MKIKNLLLLSAALCSLFTSINPAHAQGTAFTYQGQLDAGGTPANGSYDLTFTLYATNMTGVAVAGPITNSATGVTNGFFVVALDFGGVFTGSNYWLDIAARTNGAATFTELTPRQPILPVPYAIMANSASNLLGKLPVTDLGAGTASINISGNAATATSATTAGSATTATTATGISGGALTVVTNIANGQIASEPLNATNVYGTLTNNTTGNAATATTASGISGGALTVVTNIANGQIASQPLNGTNIFGTLTNNTTGNAATATSAGSATTATGISGGALTVVTNIANGQIASRPLNGTNIFGTLTNNTTGNAATATSATTAGSATTAATATGISGGALTTVSNIANIQIASEPLNATNVYGTLTNNTTGNAATATSAGSATTATTATGISGGALTTVSNLANIQIASEPLNATNVYGTLTNNTTGNAATATSAGSATDGDGDQRGRLDGRDEHSQRADCQ